MNYQPIINIGCLGSVSDGKSTMVEKLTGIKTQKHSSEKTRNITIKQGYGNMKIWENGDFLTTTDSEPKNYKSPLGEDCILKNHISFVDCPGHQELIQTMLSSISLMDGAIIVIAVDQPLNKKPQLIQHMAASKLGKLNKIIICMNKIDLVSKDILLDRKKELDDMLNEYGIVPFAIIPTSFNKKIGLKYLIKSIMTLFNPLKYVERTQDNPIFRISRTFDINKPGTNWDDVCGGVLGGSLLTGKLSVGSEIEIRPGLVSKNREGKIICMPFKTKILSIKTDTCDLDSIVPGGLIGIRTDLDPYYCKNDLMMGNVLGLPNLLPSIFNEVIIKINLINTFGYNWIPKINDSIMLQIGTRACESKLKSMDELNFKFELIKPVCISDNEHIIICKIFDKILRIVGDGIVSYSNNSSILVI